MFLFYTVINCCFIVSGEFTTMVPIAQNILALVKLENFGCVPVAPYILVLVKLQNYKITKLLF